MLKLREEVFGFVACGFLGFFVFKHRLGACGGGACGVVSVVVEVGVGCCCGAGEVVEDECSACEERVEFGGGCCGVFVCFAGGGVDFVLVKDRVGLCGVVCEQVVDAVGVEGAHGEGEAAHPVAEGFQGEAAFGEGCFFSVERGSGVEGKQGVGGEGPPVFLSGVGVALQFPREWGIQ
ncbi:MAG: hypothetical protein E6375_02720 [Dermabacter sp.]|nr:hypothetical protein [Dermabacter sp.]